MEDPDERLLILRQILSIESVLIWIKRLRSSQDLLVLNSIVDTKFDCIDTRLKIVNRTLNQ